LTKQLESGSYEYFAHFKGIKAARERGLRVAAPLRVDSNAK
jgi:hypothetical protein